MTTTTTPAERIVMQHIRNEAQECFAKLTDKEAGIEALGAIGTAYGILVGIDFERAIRVIDLMAPATTERQKEQRAIVRAMLACASNLCRMAGHELVGEGVDDIVEKGLCDTERPPVAPRELSTFPSCPHCGSFYVSIGASAGAHHCTQCQREF